MVRSYPGRTRPFGIISLAQDRAEGREPAGPGRYLAWRLAHLGQRTALVTLPASVPATLATLALQPHEPTVMVQPRLPVPTLPGGVSMTAEGRAGLAPSCLQAPEHAPSSGPYCLSYCLRAFLSQGPSCSPAGSDRAGHALNSQGE